MDSAPHRNARPISTLLAWIWADRRHWFVAALLIVIGILLGKRLDENSTWIHLRYKLHSHLQRFDPREVEVERTVLVLIGDEEYWKGELARRIPIKRSYLAKLLKALDRADPAVIAIDFDFRSPVRAGNFHDHTDYLGENAQLLLAIREISSRRPVVLPASVDQDANERYFVEPSIYDGFDFGDGDVGRGYIELPYDYRQVPLPLTLRDGRLIDSLASAVARFDQKRAPEWMARMTGQGEDMLPYGSFARADKFPVLTASRVLAADPRSLRREIAHKVVLVGAGWSRFAYGRGGPVEAADTPIGRVGRVYLHANYIEALLDRRMHRGLPGWAGISFEVAFALSVALLFHVRRVGPWAMTPRRKASGLFLLCLLVLFTAYFAWQNLGMFFDFFIPLVLLGGHAAAEKIMGWYGAARQFELQGV